MYNFQDNDLVEIAGITDIGTFHCAKGTIGEKCLWKVKGSYIFTEDHFFERSKKYYVWKLVCNKNILERIKDRTKNLYLTQR